MWMEEAGMTESMRTLWQAGGAVQDLLVRAELRTIGQAWALLQRFGSDRERVKEYINGFVDLTDVRHSEQGWKRIRGLAVTAVMRIDEGVHVDGSLAQLLICPICFQNFDDGRQPLLMPSEPHVSVCEDCVDALIQAYTAQGNVGDFRHPVATNDNVINRNRCFVNRTVLHIAEHIQWVRPEAILVRTRR